MKSVSEKFATIVAWIKFAYKSMKDGITPTDIGNTCANASVEISKVTSVINEQRLFLDNLFSIFRYSDDLSQAENVSVIISKLTNLPDEESFVLVEYFTKLSTFNKDEELKTLRADYEALSTSLKNANIALDKADKSMDKKIDELKKEHAANIKEADTSIIKLRESLTKEKSELSTKLGNKIIENDNLKKEIKALKGDLIQVKAETSNAKAVIKEQPTETGKPKRKASNSITTEQVEAIYMYKSQGKTNQETADLVKCSRSTVERTMSLKRKEDKK